MVSAILSSLCATIPIDHFSQPDTKFPPGYTNVPGAYLLYNEYIAYDIAQIRLRYLFRVKM